MFYTLDLIERKSFEYKIVDNLEQHCHPQEDKSAPREGFLFGYHEISSHSRPAACKYYDLLSYPEFILLGPNTVWSESSSRRTKHSEFESSSEYSQGSHTLIPCSLSIAHRPTIL